MTSPDDEALPQQEESSERPSDEDAAELHVPESGSLDEFGIPYLTLLPVLYFLLHHTLLLS